MNVQLIAVPYDSGWRGVRMGAGPEHLLAGGLAETLTGAGFDVGVRIVEIPPGAWTAEIHCAFQLAGDVATNVREAIDARAFPLILSGNCGPAALGAVGALGAGAQVFWFDAHGDFNTPETSSTGMLDGMAIGTLTGRCWARLRKTISGFHEVAEESVVLIGAQDLDPQEAEALRNSGIRRVTADDFRRKLTGVLASGAQGPTYIHVDLDVLDPAEGRANVYAAPGGLSRRDLEWAVATIGQAAPPAVAAITAYDPDADQDGAVSEVARRVALELVACARRSEVSP